jgi:hypothetical protein
MWVASAKYTSPRALTRKPTTELIVPVVARPPSPVELEIPVPAMVDIIPVAVVIMRIFWPLYSAM